MLDNQQLNNKDLILARQKLRKRELKEEKSRINFPVFTS